MSPQVKKFVSALGVGVAGAALVVLGKFVPSLPESLQALAVAGLGAVAHYVNAWGHAERVDQIVSAAVSAEDAEV